VKRRYNADIEARRRGVVRAAWEIQISGFVRLQAGSGFGGRIVHWTNMRQSLARFSALQTLNNLRLGRRHNCDVYI